MQISKAHEFFEWLSSGTAAAALALFLYTISATNNLSFLQLFAASFFLAAMASLVAATAVSKDISKRGKTTKKAEFLHSLILALGLLTFLGGLGILSFIVSLWLLGVLFLAFFIALVAYQIASNSLLE